MTTLTSTPEIQYDVTLGRRYRDPLTGFEGAATAVTVYLHACERVAIEFVKDGEVKFESFDAPRLVDCATGEPVRLIGEPVIGEQPRARTGGPGGRESRQARVERR